MMNINIGILANPKERMRIKTPIVKYLKEVGFKFNIEYIGSHKKLVKTSFPKEYKYNVVIIFEDNKLNYMKRTSVDFDKNISEMKLGLLEFPLDNENLDEIFFSCDNLNCPHGFYKINNKKTFRLVPYENIDYFHSADKKRTLHLANGEVEEIFQSNKMVKSQLIEDYFVNCARGYIVNIFNIKKIYKDNNEILLNSGNRIPLGRKKFQHVLRTYVKVMSGIVI
nr:LytTR family transcriptional regulator DNA-binding domain-containing protein [Sedimentibacter sp.]